MKTMFAPDVEARFKKIEDNLVVMTELQRRFEAKAEEKIDHLEAVQNAMARWQDHMADWQERMAQVQELMAGKQSEMDGKLNALINIVADLSQAVARVSESVARLESTVDRILKSRSNGGAGPPA